MAFLSKSEAVRLHRLMRNWIAQTSIQEQRCVLKVEAFKHFGWDLSTPRLCWCCAYTVFNNIRYTVGGMPNIDCNFCPVIWGENELGQNIGCLYRTSSFQSYGSARNRGDYIEAAKYAYEIAELPERVMKLA